MKIAFIIYCRAIGLYALLTLPLMIRPEIYLMSLVYVLIYGWFACCAFALLYVMIDNLLFDFVLKLFALFISVVIAVAFAYYMLGVLAMGGAVWHSDLVIFPFAAVIAGWISVCISREKISSSCFAEETN